MSKFLSRCAIGFTVGALCVLFLGPHLGMFVSMIIVGLILCADDA